MSTHVEQFSVFAAAVLERLYDNFPVLLTLQAVDFLESADVRRWFEEMDKAVSLVPEAPGSFARAEEASRQAADIGTRLTGHSQQKEVLRGTIEFLIAEDYVRCSELFSDEMIYRGCQLTAKGFSHLHKEFKDKSLSDEGSSVIRWIKSHLGNSTSLEGAIIVNIISKFLG